MALNAFIFQKFRPTSIKSFTFQPPTSIKMQSKNVVAPTPPQKNGKSCKSFLYSSHYAPQNYPQLRWLCVAKLTSSSIYNSRGRDTYQMETLIVRIWLPQLMDALWCNQPLQMDWHHLWWPYSITSINLTGCALNGTLASFSFATFLDLISLDRANRSFGSGTDRVKFGSGQLQVKSIRIGYGFDSGEVRVWF